MSNDAAKRITDKLSQIFDAQASVLEAHERRLSDAERATGVLDRLEESHRREVEDDRRTGEMLAAEERRNLQVRFDDLFSAYNETAPPPVAGQSADDYERSLTRLLSIR